LAATKSGDLERGDELSPKQKPNRGVELGKRKKMKGHTVGWELVPTGLFQMPSLGMKKRRKRGGVGKRCQKTQGR